MVASRLGVVSRLYTCLIAVERYIAVLHPLHAPRLLTRRRVALACLLLLIAPFVLNFHSFMLFDVQSVHDTNYNATVKRVVFSTFTVQNLHWVVLYNDLVLGILFSFLPIALITFCTIAILLALRASRRHRQHMIGGGAGSGGGGGAGEKGKASNEQRQVTKTLISICLVFIICTLPSITVQVARLIFADDGFSDVGRYRNLSFATITISQLFSLINSSVNFFFYVAYSNKFKSTAKKLFLRPCARTSSGSKMPVTVTSPTTISHLSDSG